MDSMLYGCRSLVYINLISFVESPNLKIDNIFSYYLNALIFCIDSKNSPQIFYFLKKKKFRK